MYKEAEKVWLKSAEDRVIIKVKRGVAQGITQGIEQGIILGRKEERATAIKIIISLVKEGFITEEIAAEKLDLPMKELEKYL